MKNINKIHIIGNEGIEICYLYNTYIELFYL